jgi:hypothetical protein
MKIVSYLLLLACAILAGCAVGPSKTANPFPIKIGLLADSQMTSQNGFPNYHFRSKFADSLVEVGIRPPALECFLTEEMLQIALNKLTQDSHGEKKGVDVILYLGDAANSGGADEIDTVLTILSRHRERTGIPICIIIGNHDYLGTGNITTPGTRFALLNRPGRPENLALTKYEVLKKFSEFNHGNNRLSATSGFQYSDNIETVEKNKTLDHDTGLYLSGFLAYKLEGRAGVDIFLLDSSDYKDAPDWSAVANIGIYGAIGSISFKDEPGFVSQTSYLNRIARSSRSQFRFLASHYPKDHLDRITLAKPGQVPLNVTNMAWSVTENAFKIPTFSETLNQNLEQLLSAEGGNYWLAGHTHVTQMLSPVRFFVGGLLGEHYYTGLNVGSTTDYRAHVAIVERYEPNRNHRMDGMIGYREIPLCQGNDALLAAIPPAIADYGRQNAENPDFKPLIPTPNEWSKQTSGAGLLNIGSSLLGGFGKANTRTQVDSYWLDMGAMILGLNRRYQQEAWEDRHTVAAGNNIRTFTDQFISRTGSNREEVLACLGLLAGAYENELIPGNCDLSPECLKKLMLIPK